MKDIGRYWYGNVENETGRFRRRKKHKQIQHWRKRKESIKRERKPFLKNGDAKERDENVENKTGRYRRRKKHKEIQ